MHYPVGKGTAKIPKKGNAQLVTVDRNGNPVTTNLWLETFATDLNLEINQSQLKNGLAYRPIRIQQRYVNFTAIYAARPKPQPNSNALTRQDFIDTIQRIIDHWVYTLNQDTWTPMFLTYYGANKMWQGTIEADTMQFAYDDVILYCNFTMLVVTASEPNSVLVTGASAPYIPTLTAVSNFGPWWYTASELLKATQMYLNNNSSGNNNKMVPLPNGKVLPANFY